MTRERERKNGPPEPTDLGEVIATSGWMQRLREHERRMTEDAVYASRLRAEEARRARLEADEAARKRRQQLLERGLPAKDLDAVLSGKLDSTVGIVEARKWLPSDRRLLVLSGPRGVGKTTAATWLAAQVDGSLFIDAARLMRVDVYSHEDMNPLEQCPLLVMDELGGEYVDAKGKLQSLIDLLVNTRYAALRKTVITTNLAANDHEGPDGSRQLGFKTRFGERIVDRIREVGRFVEMAGPSLRGKGR